MCPMATLGPSRKTCGCCAATGDPRIADDPGERGGRVLQLAIRGLIGRFAASLHQVVRNAVNRRGVTVPIGVTTICR